MQVAFMSVRPIAQRTARPGTACALSTLFAAVLVACGGNSNEPPPPPTLLTGVVATGAALSGATVSVVDSDAATADPAAVTAAADGSYSIDVSAVKAPFAVKATAVVEGTSVNVIAIVPAVTANASNTANVTSLTNAVAALVAPGGDPLALASASALTSNVTAQKLSDASALLVNTLATDASIASALGASFNPLTTPFSANGSGIDGVLDKLDIQVSGSGVAITNLAAPVADSGAPAPVQLTPAQAATPSVVPSLPASSTDVLPTATELAALGKKYQDCLALPIAQRVTMDSAGTVTAVQAACDYAPADWKSDGRNWLQQLGQFTFAKGLYTGAVVGKGQIVLTAAAANLSDPKEFKHPYCNTATCVVVRWPVTTASGQTFSSDWVLAKVNGAWNFVGNQRPYRLFVDSRLNRKVNVNTAGGAAGNTSDPYFFKDRFESTLRLTFDLSVANTSNVRAVRISGPGLPAAGVTLFRSQRCATDDRMAITYQTGLTRVVNAPTTFQFWTGGSATEFVLDAANLDGTALQMPLPVNTASSASFQDFSPAPVANQSTTIAAWSRYKFEIFHFDVLSDTPDEIVYARTTAAAENAAAGASKAWPALATSVIDAYLKPTGAFAGAVTSLATSLSWTGPAGGYVGSGYLFGQNFLSATNSQGETATYALRNRLDFEPTALGNLSAAGIGWASVAAGTSLSSFTANAGTNPNPRCTSTDLVPLSSNISDYREIGLALRGADRKLYQAIWFWDN